MRLNIEKELLHLLNVIDEYFDNRYSADSQATLLVAKTNVLIALQKYEK